MPLSTILVNINTSGWMDSNDKRIAFIGFSSNNFGGPYLSSLTWHRGHSVLKIIVWSSSLLTNIFQPLGKHNKGTRASEMSKIENFEKIQILPFFDPKTHFLGCKRPRMDVEP